MDFNLSKEILRGKSIFRSLTDVKLLKRNIVLEGVVLDLGGREPYTNKVSKKNYLGFFKFRPEVKIFRLDIDEKVNPDYKIDFEKDKIPLDDNSVDYVLVFNLLEHIYNYNFLLKEMFRVLKPGGAMIGSTPFLYKIHPSPNDFFRYSQDALEKIFKDVGFNKISIDYIGYGPFTIQYSQIEFGLPKILRLLFIWTSILLDKIILRLKSKTLSNKFPLGYLFIVKK